MQDDNKTAENKSIDEKRDIFDKLMSLPVLNIFESFYKKNKSVLLYLFFGVLTTAVSFLAAWVSKEALESVDFGKNTVSVASSVFSWICAVTFAYITNRIWVFESKVSCKKQLFAEAVSFYGGRVFTLIVETLMMWVGYSLIGVNYWLTKIAANVVVLILNYVISKLFVFKK